MPSMLIIFSLLCLAQASFGYGKQIRPNLSSKKCLDVKGGVFFNGALLQIYDCNDSPAQRWFIRSNPGSTIVQLAGQNFCVDAGDAPAKNPILKIWECFNKLPAQQWVYTDDHRIVLDGNGFCVDLTDGNLTNGTPVQLYKCSDKNVRQDWNIVESFSFEAPQMQVIVG